MLLLVDDGVMEENYGNTIRAEIEVFKKLFRHWVSTFKKDEFRDEWGLFI